jgi:hypothetical protein
VSLVNLSKFILYKREINRTVLCEFSESVKVDTVQKINRTVCCEFSKFVKVYTIQKRDK